MEQGQFLRSDRVLQYLRTIISARKKSVPSSVEPSQLVQGGAVWGNGDAAAHTMFINIYLVMLLHVGAATLLMAFDRQAPQ